MKIYDKIKGFWSDSEPEPAAPSMPLKSSEVIFHGSDINQTIFFEKTPEKPLKKHFILWSEEELVEAGILCEDELDDFFIDVNPATGLPMMGSVDIGGNPYGCGS